MKVVQSCLTLCEPMDCSPPGSSLSMEFSRQDYCSGLPFPSPGVLPDPGIEPRSPVLQADTLTSEPPGNHLYTADQFCLLWVISLSDKYFEVFLWMEVRER